MGGKKKYINIFGSFTEPFNYAIFGRMHLHTNWTTKQKFIINIHHYMAQVNNSEKCVGSKTLLSEALAENISLQCFDTVGWETGRASSL